MDELKPLTIRPVPCDLAREVCERIYNDYRESPLTYVELMMLAYRAAAEEAYARGYETGRKTAFALVDVVLERESDGQKIRRKAESYGSQVCDEVASDNRFIAKQYKR